MFLINKQKLAFSFTKERFFHSFFLEFSNTVTIAKLISSGRWYLDSATSERTILFSLSFFYSILSFSMFNIFLRLLWFGSSLDFKFRYKQTGLRLVWNNENTFFIFWCFIAHLKITQIFYRSNRPEAFCKKRFS